MFRELTRAVLLVEDDDSNRESVAKILEKEGYRTVTASTGSEGLAQVRTEKPDLDLLDLMLPEIDGLEICKRLRSAPDTAMLPFIMLTAKAEESDTIIGLELGADDYVTKPFSLDELVARVRAALARPEKVHGDEARVRRGVALKEAMATVLGDIALYWSGAVDPRSCLSSTECAASTTIETSGACSGTVGRRAMQMNRYLWDIYDAQDDGGDTIQAPYYVFVDTLNAIPSGTDWGELSSYKSPGGAIDCWDCFHTWEWRNAVLNHWSGALETQGVYFQNCMGYF